MLKNMCRACGRYAAGEKSLRIFDNKNMLWNIQVLTGLILENAKSLPDLICNFCQTELRDSIRFSDRVIAVQQQLLSSLTEDELQEVSEDYREAVREINTSNFEAKSESKIIDESEEELINKAEHDENQIVIEEHGNHDNLLEYDIIIDDNPTTQDVAKSENPSDSTEQQIATCSEDCNNSPIENYMQPDLDVECDGVPTSNEIPVAPNSAKKKRGRKSLTNGIFVCEECGNHISGRMSFELHCRRHRGDKQFQCDVCQDRFCTSSELKSHMRKHTGERPFACHYCDRWFADYSTRVKHERTHTNERPYVCQSCGKGFTTTYILKNHMLIHSGERAFRCDLCNKLFRRQTHLNTHCLSTAHKRKMERQNKGLKVN
ncbi:transcription factor Ouib [Drosophila grimshawi]|uniref:transcription factor Ouib n=1 Tax=Drosophila grimshawi TaxID=7222 RepID=UPI000C8703A1|nr:transcription factor Ouib [Drosophila grimshawi]